MEDRPQEVLVQLAHLDDELRRQDAIWWDLTRRLDGLRREIVVKDAQAHQTDYQERALMLTRQFQAALRQAEELRTSLMVEMEELRRRRRALVKLLPADQGDVPRGAGE